MSNTKTSNLCLVTAVIWEHERLIDRAGSPNRYCMSCLKLSYTHLVNVSKVQAPL